MYSSNARNTRTVKSVTHIPCQYKNLSFPGVTSLQGHLQATITDQTSLGTHAPKLCWTCRTLASRDFPELYCFSSVFVSLFISLENYFLFLYLFKTKLCWFTDMIPLHQTTCKWKCYPPCFCNRHLGLKDQLSQMPAAHPQTPRGAQPSLLLLLPAVALGECSPPHTRAAQAWQQHNCQWQVLKD